MIVGLGQAAAPDSLLTGTTLQPSAPEQAAYTQMTSILSALAASCRANCSPPANPPGTTASSPISNCDTSAGNIESNAHSYCVNSATPLACALAAVQATLPQPCALQEPGFYSGIPLTPGAPMSSSVASTSGSTSSTCKMSILPSLNICDTYIILGGAAVAVLILLSMGSKKGQG